MQNSPTQEAYLKKFIHLASKHLSQIACFVASPLEMVVCIGNFVCWQDYRTTVLKLSPWNSQNRLAVSLVLQGDHAYW